MKKNKKTGIIILSACLLVLIAGIAAVAIAKARLIDDKHIVSGASINGVDIGGLTKEQASKKVEEYKSYLKNRKVTIKYGDDKKETDTTFERLGFYIEDDDYVEDAYNIGKKGNIFKRFKEIISVNKKDVTYNLKTGVDRDSLEKYVILKSRLHNKKVINSKFKMTSKGLKATKSQSGLKVKIDDTVALFEEKISNNLKDKSMTLNAVVQTKKSRMIHWNGING